MDKALILQRILAELERERETLTSAALDARDEATNEESKAENKYDMRAQEAAYLAEGQARQAAEVTAALSAFQGLVGNASSDSRVGVGSLVKMLRQGRSSWYFCGPSRGGLEVESEEGTVTVITAQSPLGRQLLGLPQGSEVRLPARGGKFETLQVAAIL